MNEPFLQWDQDPEPTVLDRLVTGIALTISAAFSCLGAWKLLELLGIL